MVLTFCTIQNHFDVRCFHFITHGGLESPQNFYEPSIQDVLKFYTRTTGILQQKYDVTAKWNLQTPTTLTITDMGGGRCVHFWLYLFLLACILYVYVGFERNERRKWIYEFGNTSCFIFTASLTDYNRGLYEDDVRVCIMKDFSRF